METDLPGDGRFVLTERSGNSGLGRIVANTDLDDPSFIEGDVKMLIRRSHKRYLRSKRGIQIWTKIMIHAGRVNATCSSWRLNATLSPLELHLLFHFTYIIFLTSLFCYILTREHDRNIITLLYNSVIRGECHG